MYLEERKEKHTHHVMLMQAVMLMMATTALIAASPNSSTPSQPISLSSYSSKTHNNTHQGLELNSKPMASPLEQQCLP